jgi:hypothetical protein
VETKGVQAAFDRVCPDCGFELENVMRCEHVSIPSTRVDRVNPKHPRASLFVDLSPQTFEVTGPRSARLPVKAQVLTTGIKNLDKLVHLTLGQLVVFQGHPASGSLAELLCVRAQLDHPVGLNSDTVFIDGGNSFDAYAVSAYAVEHGIEPEFALSRIHISRAFTYFQLASLLTERLPGALARHNSKLAVISDITALFQDPEIKDRQDAYRTFQRAMRSISATAEIRNSLVIATNLHQESKPFNTILTQTAHTTIVTGDCGTFTRFALAHHRSLPTQWVSQQEDRPDQFLDDYLGG